MEKEKLIPLKEAYDKYLSGFFTHDTIMSYASKGKLPTKKIVGRHYVYESDIKKFLGINPVEHE